MWQAGFKQTTPNETAAVGTNMLPQTVVRWAAALSSVRPTPKWGSPCCGHPIRWSSPCLSHANHFSFFFLWSTAHSCPEKLPPSHKVKAAPIEKQLGIVLFFLCASTAVIHSESHSEISHNQHITSANVKDKQSQFWYLQPAEQGKQTEP